MKYPNLFKPALVNNKYFKNRILGAPLGVWTFSPDNYIFDYSISLFAQRAAGGAASVMLGHSEVMTGTEELESFGLYFDFHKRPHGSAALAEFAYAVRQHGAHVGVQINHSGANIHGTPGKTYFAPSPRERDDGVIIKEMSREKIAETIAMYVDSAKRLKLAGFDMLMLHGAHGWLLDQFLSPQTNFRTDEYGGSFENRSRFGRELTEAVRQAVGDEFIIQYRVSGVDPRNNPERFGELVDYLKSIGSLIDIVDVSSGATQSEEKAHTFPSYLDPRGTNLTLAEPLKAQLDIPVSVVGNISDPDFAEQVLADGKADFISMSRALVADPELPKKARCGHSEDIRPCIGCYNCLEIMHDTHFFGCDVNPRTGREHRIPKPAPVTNPKKVVIVGGGVAGMEAAVTADACGHKVILFEKSDSLGGLLKLTDGDSVKYLLNRLKNYYLTQIDKSNVEVRLNTEADANIVAAEQPDVVFLASGSEPAIPPIKGVDGANVFTCITAHDNKSSLGKRIIVIGGNMVGCETAISLHAAGKEVSIVEMTGKLHSDANPILELAFNLKMKDISTFTNARCTEIKDNGVIVETIDGLQFIPADSIVLAVGLKSRRELCDSLYTLGGNYAELGDCIKPANVRQAIRTAHYAALDIG